LNYDGQFCGSQPRQPVIQKEVMRETEAEFQRRLSFRTLKENAFLQKDFLLCCSRKTRLTMDKVDHYVGKIDEFIAKYPTITQYGTCNVASVVIALLLVSEGK
jgi:hypothetical protein